MTSTKTRRFMPSVDALEGRLLLSANTSSWQLISAGFNSGAQPDPPGTPNITCEFYLSGPGTSTPHSPTTVPGHNQLNVAMGSPLHLMAEYVNTTYPIVYGNPIANLTGFSIQSLSPAKLISGSPTDTSYSFSSGSYKTLQSFTDTNFVSTGRVSSFDVTSWMGPQYQTGTFGALGSNGWYTSLVPGADSFYVDNTVGMQDWRLTMSFGSLVKTDDFYINVVSPAATLNSTFNAGDVNNPGGQPFQFGPYLNDTDASGSFQYVRQTFTNWNVLKNSTDFAVNGVTTHYRFGAIAGGLNPDQFSGLVRNATPTPGQFYVVQVVRAPISIIDTYNVVTKQMVSNRRSVVYDASGNQLWGLDASSPQGNPQAGIPDWAWQGGSVIQGPNGPQQNYPQDGPVQVIGLNLQPINFVRDSPSISIDPNLDGRTVLLDRVNHEADFQTCLVFQPTDGIPIILVTQSWSVSSVERYIGPALNGMDIGAAWSAVYTNPANWQGTTTQTVGSKSNTPSLLNWSFVDSQLPSTETNRTYHSDPVGPPTIGTQIYSTVSWTTPPGVAKQVPNPVEDSGAQVVVKVPRGVAQAPLPIAYRQSPLKVDSSWPPRDIQETDISSLVWYGMQNKKRA